MIRHVAVIDIGKTNAKVALVDLERMAEVGLRRTANAVANNGPYPHHDVERLWAFILESLAALRDRGLITPEEYEAKKRDLLERM